MTEVEPVHIRHRKRIKSDENSRLSLNWNLNREISKLNYKIHTDAIYVKHALLVAKKMHDEGDCISDNEITIAF